MEMSGLSIGEVARRGGVRASAVRFYEKERLLPRPSPFRGPACLRRIDSGTSRRD